MNRADQLAKLFTSKELAARLSDERSALSRQVRHSKTGAVAKSIIIAHQIEIAALHAAIRKVGV